MNSNHWHRHELFNTCGARPHHHVNRLARCLGWIVQQVTRHKVMTPYEGRKCWHEMGQWKASPPFRTRRQEPYKAKAYLVAVSLARHLRVQRPTARKKSWTRPEGDRACSSSPLTRIIATQAMVVARSPRQNRFRTLTICLRESFWCFLDRCIAHGECG
jgi:hypothetical protein